MRWVSPYSRPSSPKRKVTGSMPIRDTKISPFDLLALGRIDLRTIRKPLKWRARASRERRVRRIRQP